MPLPRITRQIKEPGLLTDGVTASFQSMAHRAISPARQKSVSWGRSAARVPPAKGKTDPIDGPRKRRSPQPPRRWQRYRNDGPEPRGGALRQPRGPAHEEGHVNAALEIGDLPAAVRPYSKSSRPTYPAPPLSEVKITTVLSASPSASSAPSTTPHFSISPRSWRHRRAPCDHDVTRRIVVLPGAWRGCRRPVRAR